MGYLIAAIAALYLLSKGSLTSLIGTSGIINVAPRSTVVAPNVGAIAAPISDVASLGSSALQVTSSLAAGSSLASAIPIAGAAFSALISAFAAASAKRAKQATNENTAVTQAIPGWDASVTQIVNAYNTGQISAGQVEQALDAIMQNYFAETGPQIQPGRNGCQSGSISKEQADSQYPGMAQCSGSWGAACCVGYADLWNGVNNMLYAVNQADSSGKPSSAIIPAVFASKYGGANRPSYTVTFIRP